MVLTLTRQGTITSRLMAPTEGSLKDDAAENLLAPKSQPGNTGTVRGIILGAPVDMLRRISLFGFQDVDFDTKEDTKDDALPEGPGKLGTMHRLLEDDSEDNTPSGRRNRGSIISTLSEGDENASEEDDNELDGDEDEPTKRCSTDRMHNMFLSMELQALDNVALSIRPGASTGKQPLSVNSDKKDGILGWIQSRRESLSSGSRSSLASTQSSLQSQGEDTTEPTAECSEATDSKTEPCRTLSATTLTKHSQDTSPTNHPTLWVFSMIKHFVQDRMDTFSRNIQHLTNSSANK